MYNYQSGSFVFEFFKVFKILHFKENLEKVDNTVFNLFFFEGVGSVDRRVSRPPCYSVFGVSTIRVESIVCHIGIFQ